MIRPARARLPSRPVLVRPPVSALAGAGPPPGTASDMFSRMASIKVRENRLRRMAHRQGLRLIKSRRRDPQPSTTAGTPSVQASLGNGSGDFGGHAAVSAFTSGLGRTLDEVEVELTWPLDSGGTGTHRLTAVKALTAFLSYSSPSPSPLGPVAGSSSAETARRAPRRSGSRQPVEPLAHTLPGAHLVRLERRGELTGSPAGVPLGPLLGSRCSAPSPRLPRWYRPVRIAERRCSPGRGGAWRCCRQPP